MDQKILPKAVAWASGFGFPGSQARPKPWWSRDFGLAWPTAWCRAVHITISTSPWGHDQKSQFGIKSFFKGKSCFIYVSWVLSGLCSCVYDVPCLIVCNFTIMYDIYQFVFARLHSVFPISVFPYLPMFSHYIDLYLLKLHTVFPGVRLPTNLHRGLLAQWANNGC